MEIEIKHNFAEAVTNDKHNQFFLSASAAQTQTNQVLEQITNKKLEDTYDYINTTLEKLIVEAINKSTTQIQLTFPTDLNKATIIDTLVKAGYDVINMQNGSTIIKWEGIENAT